MLEHSQRELLVAIGRGTGGAFMRDAQRRVWKSHVAYPDSDEVLLW